MGVEMRYWQLQEAKAKFSKLVKDVRKHGPQGVTVHGSAAAVLVSMEDYQQLTRQRPGLVEFLRHSPLKGVEIDTGRLDSTDRGVEL